MLIAQHRRARALTRSADAHAKITDPGHQVTFDRMKNKVMHSESVGQARTELNHEADNIEDRLARLEKEDEINRILSELKSAQRGA